MKSKNVIKKSALVPTALVAGGAGFVGSYICEALLAKGARVIALDNLSTGSTAYIEGLLQNPNFALYNVDLNQGLPPEIESVDYIFHLAGLEEYTFTDAVLNLDSLLTNAVGTKNLLDLAHRSDAKFMLVSTVDVYEGRMSQLDLKDYFGKNKIEENRYMLTEAKRYAEALVWEYYKKYNINARIVRLPEVYGPKMNLESSGFLGGMIRDMVDLRDLTIYGDGLEKSFYLYVTDAVSGVIKAMFNEKSAGNIYSLIDGEALSILEIAYLIKGMADRHVQIKFLPSQYDTYFKPGPLKSIDTFNLHDLNWEPKVTFKEGVLNVLEFFKYSANSNSFKPAKLIQQKLAEQQAALANLQPLASSPQEEELFSLNDVKKPSAKADVTSKVTTAAKSAKSVAPAIEMPAVPTETPQNVTQRFPPVGATLDPGKFAATSEKSVPKVTIPQINVPKINLKAPDLSGLKVPLPKLHPNIAQALMILFTIIFSGFVVFVGLPGLDFYVRVTSAKNHLASAKEAAKNFDEAALKESTKLAYADLGKARAALNRLKPALTVFGKKKTYASGDRLLSSLAFFSKFVYSSTKSYAPLSNIWDVIRPDTFVTLDPEKFNTAKSQLENAKKSLEFAQADFKYVFIQDFPEEIQPYVKEYEVLLDTSVDTVDTLLPLMTSFPRVLGSDGLRKYMLLFQNSNEIRATGGFIGSYGLLTLESGKIKDLVIDDIYNPDGQIDLRNISVASPEPIARMLQEKNLHIRNANWDPDFPTSAATIQDLYFKVTGETVDGVIAIDLNFIRRILEATGSIYLAAFNEEITAENVYERAEMHSELNYVAGSSQKKNFLTVLGSKLLERLFSLEKDKLGTLMQNVLTSLDEKHMLIHFTNDSLNEFLINRNWNGAVKVANTETTGDYLYVVNSNLGGTKANYYVKNDMAYAVSLQTRDGILRGTLTLNYEHTGRDNAWPGGPYTNYVRVLTKRGAKITGAKLVTGGTEEDIMPNVVSKDLPTYTSFETDFVLPISTKASLVFYYDLSPQVSLNKEVTKYSLYWQKQPGTTGDPYIFNFSLPFGFNLVEHEASMLQNGDALVSQGQLSVDKSFYVKLQ